MAVADRAAQYLVGADVLGSERSVERNTLALQLGDAVTSDVDSQHAEQWQQSGFASRPANPTAGVGACQVVAIRQGDRDVVIAQRDSRSADIYGELAPGETCVYAPSGMARVLFKADGSITLLTTSDNTAAGATLTLSLSPTQGLIIATPWGGVSLGPGGFQAFTQDGSTWGGSIGIALDGTCQVTGKAMKCATGSVALGVSATSPCGLPGGAASTSVYVQT